MIQSPESIVEVELRNPAPRRVCMRGHAVVICAASVLLMAAFAVCGVAALKEALHLAVTSPLAHRATAVVTEIEFASGMPPLTDATKWTPACGASMSGLVYKFKDIRGNFHTGVVALSPLPADLDAQVAAQKPILPGALLPVVYDTVRGQVVSRPADAASLPRAAAFVLIGIGAMAVGASICWRCIRWVVRAHALIATGRVAVAVVLGKDVVIEDAARYFVSFSYEAEDDAIRFRRLACSALQYQRIQSGQTLTVLYPPHLPGDAIPYALLPFGR